MIVTTDLVPADASEAIERALVDGGDLSRLTAEQRLEYYRRVCESLGLNPLTRPFEYLRLNGRLVLYATRAAADQLRAVRGISITGLTTQTIGDLYVVIASGRDREGREDSATGAVTIKGLTGDALANALMRAETKAKRRLTLSLAGLGWTDESEVESIPGAERVSERPSLADRVAARVAAVAPPQPEPQPPAPEEPASAPEPPAPVEGQRLTLEEFMARYSSASDRGITRSLVGAVMAELWPGQKVGLARLSDEQRGQLWAEIDRRLLAEAPTLVAEEETAADDAPPCFGDEALYREHQPSHYREGDRWRCRACEG